MHGTPQFDLISNKQGPSEPAVHCTFELIIFTDHPRFLGTRLVFPSSEAVKSHVHCRIEFPRLSVTHEKTVSPKSGVPPLLSLFKCNRASLPYGQFYAVSDDVLISQKMSSSSDPAFQDSRTCSGKGARRRKLSTSE